MTGTVLAIATIFIVGVTKGLLAQKRNNDKDKEDAKATLLDLAQKQKDLMILKRDIARKQLGKLLRDYGLRRSRAHNRVAKQLSTLLQTRIESRKVTQRCQLARTLGQAARDISVAANITATNDWASMKTFDSLEQKWVPCRYDDLGKAGKLIILGIINRMEKGKPALGESKFIIMDSPDFNEFESGFRIKKADLTFALQPRPSLEPVMEPSSGKGPLTLFRLDKLRPDPAALLRPVDRPPQIDKADPKWYHPDPEMVSCFVREWYFDQIRNEGKPGGPLHKSGLPIVSHYFEKKTSAWADNFRRNGVVPLAWVEKGLPAERMEVMAKAWTFVTQKRIRERRAAAISGNNRKPSGSTGDHEVAVPTMVATSVQPMVTISDRLPDPPTLEELQDMAEQARLRLLELKDVCVTTVAEGKESKAEKVALRMRMGAGADAQIQPI
jgi:hypothetical protein